MQDLLQSPPKPIHTLLQSILHTTAKTLLKINNPSRGSHSKLLLKTFWGLSSHLEENHTPHCGLQGPTCSDPQAFPYFPLHPVLSSHNGLFFVALPSQEHSPQGLCTCCPSSAAFPTSSLAGSFHPLVLAVSSPSSSEKPPPESPPMPLLTPLFTHHRLQSAESHV